MLSIVVPVFKEQDNILKLFAQIDRLIKTEHQILVVYDFPEDPTFPVVKDFIDKNKRTDILLVRNNVGGGRGVLNALKTGFNEAKGEAILVTMADLSDDLAMADKMVQKHAEGAKVVCASRYMKGGKQIGGPWLKRTLSHLAGVSLYFMRGIPTHDISNNYRLYDTAMLQAMNLESVGGFEVAMEITVKAFIQGHEVTEVPATWRDRTAGESNFKLWKWLPSYLSWYFYALLRPRKRA